MLTHWPNGTLFCGTPPISAFPRLWMASVRHQFEKLPVMIVSIQEHRNLDHYPFQCPTGCSASNHSMTQSLLKAGSTEHRTAGVRCSTVRGVRTEQFKYQKFWKIPNRANSPSTYCSDFGGPWLKVDQLRWLHYRSKIAKLSISLWLTV